MEIKQSRLGDLDRELVETLLHHYTNGQGSDFWWALTHHLDTNQHLFSDSVVFIARDPVGNILGWSMITTERHHCNFGVYVAPEYRRKGVGSALLGAAQQAFFALNVFPWDAWSEGFYRATSAVWRVPGASQTVQIRRDNTRRVEFV